MPPIDAMRLHAEMLAAAQDFITFYDVMPLLQMARQTVHLPRATLDALSALYAAPHTTPHARAQLLQLYRRYAAQVQQQRARAALPLTLADHLGAVRLGVGETLTLVLPSAPMWRWQVQAGPQHTPGAPCLEVVAEATRGHGLQRFEVRAQALGHSALMATARPEGPAPMGVPKRAPAPRRPPFVRMQAAFDVLVVAADEP